MARTLVVIFFTILVVLVKPEDDMKDFEFSDPDEVMIAQESRHYQSVVEPPVRIVKPTGVTNSHRPQYNVDSFESHDSLENIETPPRKSLVKIYKSSSRIRGKEGMIKDAVIKALDRKDHVGKFAQILPIIRAMSGNQRVALASLVASQVTTPPGRTPLNLVQVRSMFGNSDNTTELMLPILLDMANLFRRAVRSGKEPREVKLPYEPSSQQLLRRFDTEDIVLDDEPFDMGLEQTTVASRRVTSRKHTNKTDTRNIQNSFKYKANNKTDTNTDDNSTLSTSTTTESEAVSAKNIYSNISRSDNGTLDLTADASNQTLAQDLPVAEKLRALSRYTDRKGSSYRRGFYTPKIPSQIVRRTTPEPTSTTASVIRRRPPLLGKIPTKRKLPTSTADTNTCELFTNTLCLNSDDYPTEAIVQSIRRNKAAAAALLAEYRDPAEGVIDGVTAAQEAKYNEQHYLVSNRRGDAANRDFASAGEAGFMCPSTVKYARPQRARATSGLWKYIVNTGEHTQTLRLEKCLKPKESCTYLTDNFKSKCVQVYNYHRLLTWDQQNGLHMDIFKVPTCCSCHIEGYSVSFPPLGHRVQETSSEHFPGEDLSAEQGNHAFENVQSTNLQPKIKSPPFSQRKPSESLPPFSGHKKTLDSFSQFSDTQNLISGSPFSKQNDNDESLASNPIDSYGNTYFPDSFNQASNIRHNKRQPSARNPVQNFDEVTLPSFLEPPTPAATSSFSFVKDTSSKFKLPGNQFKRAQSRPSLTNRRPIRKNISDPDDLVSSGTEALESFPNESESREEVNNYEEPEIGQATAVSNPPKTRFTIAPKLHAQTTEKEQTTPEPKQSSTVNVNYESRGQRINYNYHPIIDFFEEDKEIETDNIMDREDVGQSYVPLLDSEWKPIEHPISRTRKTNTVERKKHK